MLIDSHCHLDMLDLTAHGGDIRAVLAAAQEAGVGHFLNVCVSIEGSAQVLATAHRYPQVSASIGVHPGSRGGHEPTEDELVRLAADPKVVAIGETGLDYYRGPSDPMGQEERFRRHIRAARASAKPLIVHSRQAREDTLRILAEEGADAIGGVMHCFGEDWPTAMRALELGFYVSLSGIVTFPKTEELQEVARRLPLDRLLVETDAPYLAPVPQRGKQNQPAYVRHVAERIAELRGVGAERIAEATTANFHRLFKPAPTAA